jgi:hypothetical protein
MSVSQAQIITFNSITVLGVNAVSAVDRSEPLSFIQWLPYNKAIYSTPENALVIYQQYLTSWYSVKGSSQEDLSNAVQYLYVNLINEIVINYTTIDEQRYLNNLDVTNPRDLAIAVPFFSKKIKDVCLYYTTLRETAQTATTQYNLKGSNIGIKTLLYNTISNTLQSQDLTKTINTLNLSISSIRNNMVLDIEDIYDLTPDYFDVSPTLPTSAYDTSNDIRQTYFKANQTSVDPFLTLDFNQSIINAILQYPIYTPELGTQLFINPAILPSQLNFLKDSEFINNVNTGNAKNLTLNTEIVNQEKYIGADFYYVITDSTLTTYTSGQLFAANSEFANVLNKRYPTIAAVPSTEFLKTGKQLGLFFKPDKIGLLHFTNFKFTPSIDLANLQPGTVYYFPDPAKYGNVTSNTQQDFKSPLTFFEENYFNKVDFSNQYRFGDVDTNSYYQLFRSYQSREQTLEYSNAGISRYTDYEDFFTGGLDSIWNNIDVYPLTPIGQYPINQRAQELLTNDSNLFQFKSDIYGNQYGLYKHTSSIKAPLSSPIIQEPSITDLILDNNVFKPPLPLIVNPINCGQMNPLSGSQPTIIIQSYGFNFEAFTPSYVSSNFNINISECETFINPNGDLWIDSDSDLKSYDPNIYGLYYDLLAEGGLTKTGQPAYSGSLIAYISAGRPTVSGTSLSATFTYPTSSLSVYDGYWFTVDYYDGDLNLIKNYDPLTPQQYIYDYNEQNILINERIPGLNSTLDFSLTGNTVDQSLYQSRNLVNGALYCRTPDSSLIAPFSAALSAVYTKYTTISAFDITTNTINTIGDEINTECIGFDVFYDVIQIETSNHLIFDKIQFSYINNSIPGSVTYSYLHRGYYPNLEKFSNAWLNESDKQIIVCQTKLYTSTISGIDPLSATNYKTIYPKIYAVSLNSPQFLQLYPYTADQNLSLNSVTQYSLSSTDIDSTLNIIEVEKPILTFNSSTDIYDLTYLCKDAANAFYTVNTKFRYVNGVLTILSTTIYTPSSNTLHQNFGTYSLTGTIITPTFNTYNVINNTYNIVDNGIGYIDTQDSTFTFTSQVLTNFLLVNSLTAGFTTFLTQQDGISYIAL